MNCSCHLCRHLRGEHEADPSPFCPACRDGGPD